MGRSTRTVRAAALALLAAAGAYLWAAPGGGKVRESAECVAVGYEWREELSLRCGVIRREEPLAVGDRAFRFTADPGERLPAGAVMAVAFTDAAEYLRGSLLLRLRRELSERRGAGPVPDSAVRQRVSDLSRAVARGDFGAVGAAALSLALAVSPGQTEAEAALEREIAALEAAGADRGLITAPFGCFFSPYTDGWEALSPEAVQTMTTDDLAALFAADPQPSLSAGKAAAGSEWVLAALTDARTASRFLPGDRADFRSDPGDFSGEVIRVRVESDGRAAVFFRCTEGLPAVLDIRVLTVFAQTDSASGLLLDPRALREDSQGAFVWRVAGPFLRREAVSVLRSLPEGALVSSPGLREGDRVVTGDGEFYDGMMY